MQNRNLNRHSLSQSSGIPYTTVDGWYKKGYENTKLSTLQKLADFFGVTIDYLARNEIENPSYGLNAQKNPSAEAEGAYLTKKALEVARAYQDADQRSKDIVCFTLGLEPDKSSSASSDAAV